MRDQGYWVLPFESGVAGVRVRDLGGLGARHYGLSLAQAQAAGQTRGGVLRQVARPPEAAQAELPDTSGMSDDERFDLYAGYIERFGSLGAKQHLREGKRVMLGLRISTSSTANSGDGVYDDRMVVLWRASPPATPLKNAVEFNRFSTDPTGRYDPHFRNNRRLTRAFSSNGTRVDANGDGTYDLGRLGAGSYEMMPATHGSDSHKAFRPTPETVREHAGRRSIERDVNGDGIFDANESRTDLDQSFKIHKGYRSMTGSAGCQVVHIDDYARFLQVTRRDDQGRWHYVLVKVR